MKVNITERAKKDISGLDRASRKKVYRIIDRLRIDAAIYKKLKTSGKLYRMRAGDYRIIFEVQEGRAFILKVEHRREVYRNI